ncbi:MAG: 30S ribosomal protein S17 [Candidatus Hydrogenedentes bacterium]|jgi:small subunit ribosomal protein S17|nr:30S ribosomal protein S17 [Candidatus Hydrogenedentota bacterium]
MSTDVLQQPELQQSHRKERVGIVTSTSMNKTITVSVSRVKEHRLYNKALRRNKKYKAHDEVETCRVGDVVRIRETRPLSKTKRWRLVEVIKRAE